MFKYSRRKPDPLKLLIIAVTVAVLMTSAVGAAEPFYQTLNLTELADGDLVIAPFGRQGAALHMLYTNNPHRAVNAGNTAFSNQPTTPTPSLFLTVRVPW